MSAPGRTVTTVNAAVSVALLVLLATIAFVVRPPAPPGIAEFAPQAAKPITKAPPGQTGAQSATVNCPPGKHCALGDSQAAAKTRTAASPVAGVPSALQCFSWPDGSVTQTF